MTTSEPKVLILSQSIPETRFAGSLLLYRLLLTYPRECLRVVGPKPHPASELLSCEYAELDESPGERLSRTRFAPLKRALEAYSLWPGISKTSISSAVNGFQPEVVISIMQGSDYCEAAVSYCKANELPLILIVHDMLEDFEKVPAWAVPRQRNRFAEIYRSAAERLCISPAMRDYLQDRYGISGNVLYPIRSEKIASRPMAAAAQLISPLGLTIAYVGSLSYGYEQGIQEILPAIEAGGHHLNIYSYQEPQLRSRSLSYRGGFPPEEVWRRVQSEADVVLLPYSTDFSYDRLYRTHFPSKLPEYLALGMPVLVSGPSYAAGVSWARQNPDAAMWLNESGLTEVRKRLTQLKKSADVRAAYSARSLATGKQEFSPKFLRNQFTAAIRRASRATNDERD